MTGHPHLVMDETPQTTIDPYRPGARTTWDMLDPELRATIQTVASPQQLAIAVGIANGATIMEIARNIGNTDHRNIYKQRYKLGAKLQALTSQRALGHPTPYSEEGRNEPIIDPAATTHQKGYKAAEGATSDLTDRTPGYDTDRMRAIPILGAGLAVQPGTDPAQAAYSARPTVRTYSAPRGDIEVPTTPLRGAELDLLENMYGDRELTAAILRAYRHRRATPREVHAVLDNMTRHGAIRAADANRVMRLRFQWTRPDELPTINHPEATP